MPLIRRVLNNFVPDEFCPGPVPEAVFETLNTEVSLYSTFLYLLYNTIKFGIIAELLVTNNFVCGLLDLFSFNL